MPSNTCSNLNRRRSEHLVPSSASMARETLQSTKNRAVFITTVDLGCQWHLSSVHFSPGGLFASIGQADVGLGSTSQNPRSLTDRSSKLPMCLKYLTESQIPDSVAGASSGMTVVTQDSRAKEKAGAFKFRLKITNPSLRRLISGAVAGTVSRTAVAPLETIRTHLMVGSNGFSTAEVFQNIMKTEGWTGLFRGNWVNVIRVAPSKAIELFAYDTVIKQLSSKTNIMPNIPMPSSLLAGAFAGVISTICTYPLELLKTRLTIQGGVYENLTHAFLKILREEGPAGLYRGLTPSLIGVVPYSATNYFAYETLRGAYKKIFRQAEVGNIATLLIGSTAGAFASSATYPLEVARKHMQIGVPIGGQGYENMLHALVSILENEGLAGLYKGLAPSCLKLVPAAGISFMCYEACKRILVERDDGK